MPAAGVPPVLAATKGGALPGIRTDIGLLETTDTRVAIAVMTKDSADTGFGRINEGETCIADITRAVASEWLNREECDE